MAKKGTTLGGLLSVPFKVYRGTTDWAYPTIDRVVRGPATFMGLNSALALSIYHGIPAVQQALEERLPNNLMESIAEVGDKIPDIVTGTLTAGALLATYAVVNYKAILPLTGKALRKKNKPSWPQHAKTWATGLAIWAVYSIGGIQQDIDRFRTQLGRANSFQEYVGVFTNETNLRIIDRYLSGRQANRIIQDDRVQGVLAQFQSVYENFEDHFMSPEDSRRIENEMDRLRISRPDINYTGVISQKVSELRGQGIETPEDLLFSARAVYLEAAFDPLNRTEDEIRRGMEAVVWVMYNRWEFDNDLRIRHFSNRNRDGFLDIITKNGLNPQGNRVYEFTCIPRNAKYFYENRGERGWDMYANGMLNVAVGVMNQQRADWALQAVIDVLEGNVSDPTGGALFYQNIELSDSRNQDWATRYQLQRTTDVGSHTFWEPIPGSPKWREIDRVHSKNVEPQNFDRKQFGVLQSQKDMLVYKAPIRNQRNYSFRRAG